MALKKYKPKSPVLRFRVDVSRDSLAKAKPERSLVKMLHKGGGRNNQGRITVWQRGGGHKRKYRVIDFKRGKHHIPAVVKAIEYDPNRSARIALLFYKDGEKRYILAPEGLSIGDRVVSGEKAEVRVGNSLPLARIPMGMTVHNIEMSPGKGGQVARSAGAGGQVIAKEGEFALIKMPSGEIRKFRQECFATVGYIGNTDHFNISLGKAGRSRWRGKRPHVRGVAMNPIDHPMGGGEGRSSGGRHPSSPWGKLTKGLKTRKKRKPSDAFIVKRRK
ncbi:50S ribosomal protein L2 [Candidatus Saccharibacteria bacterium]|nr:50S ribosomal protein L2 [Candidatus Saccharibacteria bacterium]NIV03730.1 50S ribosomal protein L2 [Calditrichia bacterium]NIV72031.1 50S ribosomal protein L2 [Calditrichia bacterium]NIV98864.1 50S ribosomal protein L2 [Candidatus Saccharibacteria bacterium]NIW79141.1 50S ribosomal protein L2 [Calditrichia bacterium]